MIEFDLSRQEFIELVDKNKGPAMVQLMAKVDTKCTPLQLYTILQKMEYSYLLESVEKEKRHARFSFVGADPDVSVTIKDRILTLGYEKGTALAEHIISKLQPVCTIELYGEEGYLQASVNKGSDILDALRAVFPTADGVGLLNQKRFDRQTFLGGAIGYNAYDIVHDCWIDIDRKFDSDTPDMQFALTTKTFVFDHLEDETYIIITPFVTEESDLEDVYEGAIADANTLYEQLSEAEKEDIHGTPIPEPITAGIECSMEQEEFEKAVRKAKKHIIDGDIFQVVLSRRYSVKIEQTPLELYRILRNINPSPYMYIFDFEGVSIVGASPETLMTVHDRKVITNPIAGTCPRGKDEEEDKEYADHMMADEKERAEHVMLVDLGRNDVRMVSKGGSVNVDDFMTVVKYSHVQHIESTVSGTLRDECDQFDATRAIFPAGTLSGAPKIRAMEIIDDLEMSSRGVYGGGVGYYSWNGDSDFAIVIRTLIIKGDTAYIQAGAGIVADSDPTYEYEETERKMAAMVKAIGGGQ